MVIVTVYQDVSLGLLSTEDALDFYSLIDANRVYLSRWLTWPLSIQTEDQAQAFIQGCQEAFRRGEKVDLVIRLGNKLIGSVALFNLCSVSRRAELGYWISEEYQGKGVMTASVRALLTYGFQTLSINRIEARCCPENERSISLLKRCGFTQEGHLREVEWVHDHFEDDLVFGLLKREWSG